MEFGKKEKATLQYFSLTHEDVREMLQSYFWDKFQIDVGDDFSVDVLQEGPNLFEGYYIMGEGWVGEEE